MFVYVYGLGIIQSEGSNVGVGKLTSSSEWIAVGIIIMILNVETLAIERRESESESESVCSFDLVDSINLFGMTHKQDSVEPSVRVASRVWTSILASESFDVV